jgi:hypothetical protein
MSNRTSHFILDKETGTQQINQRGRVNQENPVSRDIMRITAVAVIVESHLKGNPLKKTRRTI